MHQIHPLLLDTAAWKLNHEHEKRAFVPTGGDPAAAGAAGGDPSAAGGAPPGDPSAGGAPPPMDPSMAGGGGGAAPPFDPSTLPMLIQQAVQQAMAANGGGAGGAGASPTGPAGVGQKMKIDPTMVYLKLGRQEKLLINMYQQMGWTIPPDILNDDQMIQQAAGQGGGALPAGGAPPPGGAPPGGGAPPPDPAAQGPQGLPSVGESPAVQPMTPPKTASFMDLFRGQSLLDSAAVAEFLLR